MASTAPSRSRLFAIASALLALAAGPAAAQSHPYHGTWAASWKTPTGQPAQAVLNLENEGGTWQQVNTQAQDPCLRRQHQVTVSSATADELRFVVQRAKTLTGCRDMHFQLKPSGDRLEGTFDIGELRPVTLMRK